MKCILTGDIPYCDYIFTYIYIYIYVHTNVYIYTYVLHLLVLICYHPIAVLLSIAKLGLRRRWENTCMWSLNLLQRGMDYPRMSQLSSVSFVIRSTIFRCADYFYSRKGTVQNPASSIENWLLKNEIPTMDCDLPHNAV